MSKTIRQALIDEIIYPIPEGLVENKMIARKLDGNAAYDYDAAISKQYKGAFADCLVALVQAVSFSESDKSIGTLTDEVKKKLLFRANAIYAALGEELVPDPEPTVYINC
jgi:hypothetical protein